jgi:hypothetical protein
MPVRTWSEQNQAGWLGETRAADMFAAVKSSLGPSVLLPVSSGSTASLGACQFSYPSAAKRTEHFDYSMPSYGPSCRKFRLRLAVS